VTTGVGGICRSFLLCGVDRVRGADSEFEGLYLSVDVVDTSVRGSRFVDEVKIDDDDDEDKSEEVEHKIAG
jgi:hypothetical protein